MARTSSLQTNLTAGELDPDIAMRQDTEQYRSGAKSLHNRRCLIGGGCVRRPGTWKRADLAAATRLERWVINQSTQYVMALSDGRADFYVRNVTTGALSAAGSVTSAPWTGDTWREVVVQQSGNTMILTHQLFWPQVITRTGAASWTLGNFAFATGPAARPEQPYLNFAPLGTTLTCSDVTGSITLTISGAAPWFTSLHVGQYIRYHKKACLITAVAVDGLSCTATVVERLPETYSLVVTASTNFAIGEVVAGSTSGARAIITAIPDATHVTVILTDSLIPFVAETLVGPQGTTAVSSNSTTTNGAVTDWDEQMFGPVFGYPSCIALHRNRVLFAGHLTAPSYLVGSALGNVFSFNVGDGSDADAILESLGDAEASRIVHLHSAEQLIVATDAGLYYVPEGENAPFTPSSMAFLPFGSPWPIAAAVSPVAFDGGVLFVSKSLVIKAAATGDNKGAWSAEEVSVLSGHLFKTPTDLSVVSNFSGGSERYAVFRNTDGTLAAMQLMQQHSVRNVTPWETDRETDTFQSVVGIENDLYVSCIRSVAGNTVYTLEHFDQALTLDAATEFDSLDDISGVYGLSPVHVVTDSGFHLGEHPLSLEEPPAGPYYVGFDYESEIELLPPIIEDSEGSHSGKMMRILEARVHVASSARFAANGYELHAYHTLDDPSAVPPLKSGPQRFQFLGWRRAPTLTITQTDPLPLKVLAIETEVAY